MTVHHHIHLTRDAGIIESYWNRKSGHYQSFRSFIKMHATLRGVGAVEGITEQAAKVLAGHDVRRDELRREVEAALAEL